MPRYEYKCKACDKTFEAIHGLNDTVDSCRFCGSEVRRLFHPVGIIFKGSGFYATDNRNKKGNISSDDNGEVGFPDNGKGKKTREESGESAKN